jgi:photosystem II stability/assembly factor-like uncharacterized protein
MFAGTYGGGVFLSLNNGSTWTPVNTGLTDSLIVNLCVSGNTLLAGTQNGGVFRTTNMGASWSAINNGFNNLHIYSLASAGNNLYAATFDGVFYSVNNGQTWNNTGCVFGHVTVSALMCHNNSIYAGTSGGGVYLSNNNGQNCTLTNNCLNNAWAYDLTFDGTNTYVSTLGSGVFKSTDNGDTWTSVNTGLEFLWVRVVKASGGMVYAGTGGGGIYRSSDGGLNWNPCNNGLGTSGISVSTLVVDGGTIFAKTNYGVFKSTNNAASWTFVGFASNSISDILVFDSNVVMAGSAIFYFSTDFGATWNISSPTIPGVGFSPLCLLKHNNILFVTIGGGEGIFKSTDMGITWTDVNNGFSNESFNSMAIFENNIFAGSEYYFGVILSLDDGASWTQINSGLTDLKTIYSLLVTHQHLFATMNNKVYRYLLDEIVSTRNHHQSSSFSLNPNPARDRIILQSEFPIGSRYRIVNQVGVTVKSGKLMSTGRETISLSGLQPGLYFMSLISNDCVQTKKFVKLGDD